MATAPNSVSFVNGLQPPQAIEGQGLGMEQQALLKALQESQEGLEPKPINGGRYNAIDFSGLANALVSQRMAGQLQENRTKQVDLQRRYQEAVLQALKAYDPKNPNSIRDALMSPYPEVRTRATEDLKEYNTRYMEAAKGSSQRSQVTANGDLSLLQPKQDLRLDQGSVVDLTEGQKPTLVAGQNVRDTLPDGTVINRNTLTGKEEAVVKAPQTTINMGNAPLAEAMKLLPEDYKSALSNYRIVQNTEQALNALKAGARTGYGEPFLQNARTLVSGLTGLQFDSTTPTAVLAKALAENTIQSFGGNLGTGVSNADVAFMKQAVGGSTDDPKALERILAIRAGIALDNLKRHNENVEELAANPENKQGTFTRNRYKMELPAFGLSFATPEASASFQSVVGRMPLEKAMEIAKRDYAKPTATPPGGKKRSVEDLLKIYLPNGGG